MSKNTNNCALTGSEGVTDGDNDPYAEEGSNEEARGTLGEVTCGGSEGATQAWRLRVWSTHRLLLKEAKESM